MNWNLSFRDDKKIYLKESTTPSLWPIVYYIIIENKSIEIESEFNTALAKVCRVANHKIDAFAQFGATRGGMEYHAP